MSGLDNSLIESLRKYTVDLKGYNHLNLNEEELDSIILEEAVKDGALAYDTILPLSTTAIATATVESLDDKLWFFIKKLAGIEALTRLVHIHIRNHNPVNDQGFTVDEYNKWREWLQLRGTLRAEAMESAEKYKRALNLQSMGAGWSTLSHDRSW